MKAKTVWILLLSCVFVFIFISLFFSSDYRDILYSKKNLDINQVEIDSSALQDIRTNISSIKYQAKLYNITPEAIAGIIIAERSLNKSPANQFEEYYVQQFFLNKSESYLSKLADATKKSVAKRILEGESQQEFKFRLKHGLIWTIGLCQISIIKALEIDSLISRTNNQLKRTVKENIECLLEPSCNIKYCAFELSSIRDKYKKEAGLDISQNVAILCTLYNVGKVTESIARYNHSKKLPIANDFGKYAALKSDGLKNMIQ